MCHERKKNFAVKITFTENKKMRELQSARRPQSNDAICTDIFPHRSGNLPAASAASGLLK
jgi:hypothetical protein